MTTTRIHLILGDPDVGTMIVIGALAAAVVLLVLAIDRTAKRRLKK